MNANNLTIKAQEMLQAAFSYAQSLGNQSVEPCHLLYAMLKDEDSLSAYLLAKIGANTTNIENGAAALAAKEPKVQGGEQSARPRADDDDARPAADVAVAEV